MSPNGRHQNELCENRQPCFLSLVSISDIPLRSIYPPTPSSPSLYRNRVEPLGSAIGFPSVLRPRPLEPCWSYSTGSSFPTFTIPVYFGIFMHTYIYILILISCRAVNRTREMSALPPPRRVFSKAK